MKTKRILAMLLTLIMVLSLLPMAALATDGVECSDEKCTHVAAIGAKHYETLVDAVAAVQSGETIDLLKSSAGNGIKVPSGSNFTVDFHGYTYDVNGELVGSTGTETNSLQLLKDSTITFKNGTLTSTQNRYMSQILIQNYSNLTLDNMTVSADVPFDYIVSNNNGNVVIKDTTINAAEGKVAFDVCRYSSYTGPSVTVQGNSVINGNVEISSSGAKEGAVHQLNVTGGTFNGTFVKYSSPNFVGNITGGTFSDFTCLDYLAENANITVKLASNVTQNVVVPDVSSLILDLNDKTFTGYIDFYAGNLTIQNGTVAGTVYVNATDADTVYNHVTVAEDATIESTYAVILYQKAVGENNFGSTIDVAGRLNGNLWVMGNILTNLETANNPCVININDGAVIAAGTGNVGIALNGAAVLNVNEANISADTGIEVRAGKMTVNGATITGNAVPTEVAPNGNGTTTDGAGIAVAQHTTKLPISVTVNSGTISGYTALYESNPQNNSAEDIAKESIVVKGGTFNAINDGTLAVYSENRTNFITGGTFSSDPTPYVASGYAVSGSGPYTVYVPYVPSVPDNTTTETVKNEDGSTTTTTTDKSTGTVTEVTTSKPVTDEKGTTTEAKTETVTTKDGEVTTTETVKATDTTGTTATKVTETNAAGETTTSVESKVSTQAVAEAAKNDVPVTLPVEVTASTNAETAPVVKVDVPASAGTVAVEVPVANVTPGTVAVIVNADGTEEVISASKLSENGVVVELDGSSTVKIVDNSQSFADVQDVDHWSSDAVDYTSARGLMNGVSGTQFAPEQKLSRSMVVQMLYNMEGCPAAGDASFADVDPDQWYADAIAWAAANGIVSGMDGNLFDPEADVTREQLANMLRNYAAFKGYDVSQTGADLGKYDDGNQVSGWAADSMDWAVSAGLINGRSATELAPTGSAKRCEGAQMIMFFCENLTK